MKDFVIRRDTWHYKLNKTFFNGSYMPYWEDEHPNFCSYWQSTVLRLIALIFLTLVATIFIAGLITLAWLNPLEFASIVGFFLLCLVTAFFLWCLQEVPLKYFLKRASREAKEDKPPSLFKQKYVAYKGKFCPRVSFERGE